MIYKSCFCMTSSIMTSSINQYLVKINTGGPNFPYYNQDSYGDQYNGAVDNEKPEPGIEYTEIFKKLIELEKPRQSPEEPNALLLCQMMRKIEETTEVGSYNFKYELEHFKSLLDRYFAKKTWSFNNLSDSQKLQMKLAKFAVDVYESKQKQRQEQQEKRAMQKERMLESMRKPLKYQSNTMDLQLKGEIFVNINSLKQYIHDMVDKMKEDQIAAQKEKDQNRPAPYTYIQANQVLTIQKIIHWIDRTNALLDEKLNHPPYFMVRSDILQIKENLNTIKTLLNEIPKAPGFYTPTPEQVTHITTEIDVIMQQL